MSIELASLNDTIYSLFAAFFIYLGRVFFRNIFFKISNNKIKLEYIKNLDIIAIIIASFYKVSWGGIDQDKKKENLITFIISQLYYPILIVLVFIYIVLNTTNLDSYFGLFLIECLTLSSILFVVNFIPLPPFDLYYIIMNPISKKFSYLSISAGKIMLIGLVMLQIFNNNFYIIIKSFWITKIQGGLI